MVQNQIDALGEYFNPPYYPMAHQMSTVRPTIWPDGVSRPRQ